MPGHHVYKTHWSPKINKELCCAVEEENSFDRHAVAVLKDGGVVGHVPRELARIYFLQKQHSRMTCRITGLRKPSETSGKGLVVHFFTGIKRHIHKLVTLFTYVRS